MKNFEPSIKSDLACIGRGLKEARALHKTGNPGDLPALARRLDGMIEYATFARGRADGLSGVQCARLVRRVRKALGYTYP